MKVLWGLGGLALHGLNIINIPMEFEETDIGEEELNRCVKIIVKGREKLLASIEDHVVYCVLKSYEKPIFLDYAVMLIVSKPLDKNYMFRRARSYGVEDDLKKLISYIHKVMVEGWRYKEIDDVIDWYYRVALHYLNLHPDMDHYINYEVNHHPILTPYEIVREAWKQIQTEI